MSRIKRNDIFLRVSFRKRRHFFILEGEVEIYRVAFIGHRYMENFLFETEERMKKILCDLLDKKEFVEFYIGRNGDFDVYAASVIKRVQRDYSPWRSALILVCPYDMKDMEYYEKYYDEVFCPVERGVHYKGAIGVRNRWLAENCDLLLAYVEKHRKGGAYKTLRQAQRAGKTIINLAE